MLFMVQQISALILKPPNKNGVISLLTLSFCIFYIRQSSFEQCVRQRFPPQWWLLSASTLHLLHGTNASTANCMTVSRFAKHLVLRRETRCFGFLISLYYLLLVYGIASPSRLYKLQRSVIVYDERIHNEDCPAPNNSLCDKKRTLSLELNNGAVVGLYACWQHVDAKALPRSKGRVLHCIAQVISTLLRTIVVRIRKIVTSVELVYPCCFMEILQPNHVLNIAIKRHPVILLKFSTEAFAATAVIYITVVHHLQRRRKGLSLQSSRFAS